jgi:serine/threonine-protein kinase
MSPEHFFDFKRADQKADVYSLGKILFEAVEGKIKSGIMPFKIARLAKIETPFFQQLDGIIQRATAESRDERTTSVQDLRRQLEQVVDVLEIQKQSKDSTKVEHASFLSHPKWIWSGVVIATLSVLLMAIWHFMGEPGWDFTKGGFSRDSGVHESQSKFDNAEVTANRDTVASSTVSEYTGKQHLVSGGAFIVPASAGGTKQQTVHVEPFFMDEFFVTNQQFVDFLNYSLARISLENGVVKGDGANWCLLGEVHAGYEPIVYGNNEFQISDPAYASSPVLRVTGYGASAFAKFFGRRLPIEVELLYAMSKGANSHQLNAGESDRIFSEAPMGSMMGKWPMEKENGELRPRDQKPNTSNESIVQKLTLPAVLYNPNTLSLRGLNDGIGEWALKSLNELSKDQTQRRQYAVVGGMEGAPKEENSLPEVVVRHPWEGFEEVGFRTVKSTTGEKLD